MAQRLTALAKRARRDGRTGGRDGGAGAAERVGVRGPAVGRGAGRRRRAAVAGRRRVAGSRSGRAHWPARRRRCAWTETCCTSTGTGSKSSRSPTTCRRDDRGEAREGVPGHRPAVPRGVRGAARGGESRAVARADGADGRAGYGQDDDGRAAAGVACRAGTRLRIALAAPTGKAAARLQEAVQLEVGKLDAADQEALSGLHATTLHRLLGQQAGHVGAVPAQPGQPVAARRDRRRRDVDGVADDDGAAAGGGAPGCAVDPGRRSGPAGVGGSGCGAGGSGRRARTSVRSSRR